MPGFNYVLFNFLLREVRVSVMCLYSVCVRVTRFSRSDTLGLRLAISRLPLTLSEKESWRKCVKLEKKIRKSQSQALGHSLDQCYVFLLSWAYLYQSRFIFYFISYELYKKKILSYSDYYYKGESLEKVSYRIWSNFLTLWESLNN